MSRSSSARRPLASLAMVVSALLGAGTLAAVVPASAIAAPLDADFVGFTDKSELRAAGRDVVAGGVLVVADGSAPAGTGTTFYVDSQAGDDSAVGTSAATAWKSFANVNGTDFEPGDRILLKAGSSWSASGAAVAREAYDYTTWSGGQATNVAGADATALLAPGGSGTAEAPIVLSSYGDGAAPELNGLGVVNDALQLSNQEHWSISNLEISNETAGFDASSFRPARNLGQAPGDENTDTGDLRGIHVQAENAGTLRGFDIHNVFVRDVTGYTWSVSAAGVDRSKRTGGIVFEGLKGDAQTASQFEDVNIRDNVVANTAFANLVFKQFAGMGTNRYQDLAPGWGDRTTGRMATDGTLTEDPNWRPHSSIQISGNYLTNRDTQYGWDSMYLTSVRGATVEENLIDGAGVSGIEMYYADDVVVQNNEVAELKGRTGAADSNGIDPDRATSNILIQGNYIHESGEGILLCGFGFSSAVVRYNIIRDIERNYINPHGDTGVNVVHNNLMYNTIRPIRNNSVGFFESSGSAGQYLTARNHHLVFNNVFFNTRADVAGSAFRTEFPGVQFGSNSYFGPGVTAPAADRTATIGDPLFTGDPAVDLANATIGTGSSPLISAGQEVDLAQIVPGFDAAGNTGASQVAMPVDFFGAALSNPPHIGPTSFEPADGSGLVSGLVSDVDGTPVGGATVTYGPTVVTADARGRYFFEAPAGAYVLVASAAGYLDGGDVQVTLGDGRTIRTDLTLGETTATEGTIAGRVLSSGAGVPAATVTLSKESDTLATATTAADGTYSFPGVTKGGGYTVSASKDGYQTITRSDVTVQAARTATVDLVLRREAGATTYAINETFDDEATGAFAQTADGALTARPAPAVGTIAIVDDAADAGNKYLRIDKTSASAATLGVHNAGELNLTGVVTIEARLKRTTTNGTPNQLAMYSYTESSWNAGNPASSSNPSATIGFAGGKILTHNVTGASSVRNVSDYTVGEWHTVRNVVDLDAGTFDFYVDDMTAPVLVGQPLRTKVDDLDYFLFFINGSNVGDLLVDYFRINTGTPYDYDDASLSDLTVAGSEGDVGLTQSADGLTYSGEVEAFAEKVSLSVQPRSGFATVTVNGTEVEPGTPVEVMLANGSPSDPDVVTTVPVLVTAEDGTQRSHTVKISQVNPSQIASLRDLSIDGYELSPAFDPERKGAGDPYSVRDVVDGSVDSVTLEWSRGWDGQQVQINGDEVAADARQATVALRGGTNTIEVTVSSFAGEFSTYVITVERADSDTVKPTVTLVAPTTAGPFTRLDVQVDAADDRGLQRVVANIYKDGKLVKSTQTAANGAKAATHTASGNLPDGTYTIRYNASDLAGNVSQTGTFEFTIDATKPVATIKDGASYTVKTGESYDLISFKLSDAGKIDKVELNGKVKDLTNNQWSDVNYVKPGTFGARKGANTLVVFDVAGNTQTYTFTLN